MKKRKGTLIAWLVGGVILFLGPLWGIVGTVIGMIMAFDQLAQASPDPGRLASDISLTLYTTVAGYIACPIGLVIIIVVAIKLGKREGAQEG